MGVLEPLVSPPLPKEEIARLDREETESLAFSLGIDVVGRTLEEIKARCYEVANGLPPEGVDTSWMDGVFAGGSATVEAPEPDPDLDVAEDDARVRMFDLVSEMLADQIAGMTETEARHMLSWCPTLPSGESADCFTCPLRSFRSCYARHRFLVE